MDITKITISFPLFRLPLIPKRCAVNEIGKIPMYEYAKYREKPKLCYTDTGSFIVHMKSSDAELRRY